MEKVKVLVTNSGGIDSAFVINKLVQDGKYEIHSLTFIANGFPQAARDSAKIIAEKHCASHREVELIGDYNLRVGYGLAALPMMGIILGFGISMAEGYDAIVSGLRDDSVDKDFNEKMHNWLSTRLLKPRPVIYRPLVGEGTDEEIVRKYNIPAEEIKDIINCNEPNAPCGVCRKCLRKAKLLETMR